MPSPRLGGGRRRGGGARAAPAAGGGSAAVVLRARLRDALMGADLAARTVRGPADPGLTAECEVLLASSLRRAGRAGELLARLADMPREPARGSCSMAPIVSELVPCRIAEADRPALHLPEATLTAAVAPEIAREVVERFLSGVLAVRRAGRGWQLLLTSRGGRLPLVARCDGWRLPPEQLAVLVGLRRSQPLGLGGLDVDAWELALAGELSRRSGGGAGLHRGRDRCWRVWIELPAAS